MTSTLVSSSATLLSELMRREGITTQWLAEATGLSTCAVRSLLRAEVGHSDHKSARPETVAAIAEAFGLQVIEIAWALPIAEVGKPSGTSDRAHKSASHRSVVCPRCYVELPATGKCDNCD